MSYYISDRSGSCLMKTKDLPDTCSGLIQYRYDILKTQLLLIVIKSSVLDIDRIFESVSDRELDIVLDVKVKFIIFSVT